MSRILVDRVAHGEALEALRERISGLPRIRVGERTRCDLECIGTGVYSPLVGFLEPQHVEAVVEGMRLADGIAWPLPIVLDVARDVRAEPGEDVVLEDEGGPLAILSVTSRTEPDRRREARACWGTDDPSHPGVRAHLEGETRLSGPITLLGPIVHRELSHLRRTPAEVRAEIAKRGWRSIAAFQTRNPIHRAHEYLTKVALECVDGLLVHPLLGSTKSDDVPAPARVKSYEALLAKWYPRDRVLLSAYPAAMRYGGPREAVLHALSRRNYGCTHFIVGRDHAGVGSWYGPYDAQNIFDRFREDEIGIRILPFENSFYCAACESMASAKTCPHGESDRLALSGTRLREMLSRGERPPAQVTRREVAEAIAGRALETPRAKSGGFTVWLTGLSGAGKSTIAEGVAAEIRRRGLPVEVLDGDVVRKSLSKGLGFSREDRDENIRRIGFVAGLLARNGVAVIVAAISPYRATRDEVRASLGDFVEVHVDAPLATCEARDPKGLYAKARAGELAGFTGIDDPYEEPLSPEAICDTSRESAAESVGRVFSVLEAHGWLPLPRVLAAG